MIIFNSDLDNTMIYSYKHDIGEGKIGVENYEGRVISFVTLKTMELMKKVRKEVLFVPTTTRTVEQYERIDFGLGTPEYALCCNGGVLLKDGVWQDDWYQESLKLISSSTDQMKKSIGLLEKDEDVFFDIRFINDLFVFTKSHEPLKTVEYLKDNLDSTDVDIFNNGIKVYVVPKNLSKGQAILRFKEYIKAVKETDDITVVAAGDSEFDITMINEADIPIAPAELKKLGRLKETTIFMKEDRLFSEQILEYIMDMTKRN